MLQKSLTITIEEIVSGSIRFWYGYAEPIDLFLLAIEILVEKCISKKGHVEISKVKEIYRFSEKSSKRTIHQYKSLYDYLGHCFMIADISDKRKIIRCPECGKLAVRKSHRAVHCSDACKDSKKHGSYDKS